MRFLEVVDDAIWISAFGMPDVPINHPIALQIDGETVIFTVLEKRQGSYRIARHVN